MIVILETTVKIKPGYDCDEKMDIPIA